MKGSSMHFGTSSHKSALNMVAASALKDTKPHTSGHTHTKPEIKWGEEKETSSVTTTNKEKGTTTTKKEFETEGTSKRPSRGKAKGVKACDPAHPNYPKSCEEYKKTLTTSHVKTRDELSDTKKAEEKLIKLPTSPPVPLPTDNDGAPTPSEYTPPKKKIRDKKTKIKVRKPVNWRQMSLKARDAWRKINPVRGIKKLCRGKTCYKN